MPCQMYHELEKKITLSAEKHSLAGHDLVSSCSGQTKWRSLNGCGEAGREGCMSEREGGGV